MELGNFKIIIKEFVGHGSYGQVYSGMCLNNDLRVISKFNRDAETNNHEGLIIRALNENKFLSFPELYVQGLYQGKPVLIMEQLGSSISKILNDFQDGFSFKTVQQIGIKLITMIEELHSIGYIHCDIKADNICVGNGIDDSKLSEFKLIDFGISENYSKFPDFEFKEPKKDEDHRE